MKKVYVRVNADSTPVFYFKYGIVFILTTLFSLFFSQAHAQNFRSSSQASSGNGVKTLTVPKPAGTTVGDVMVAGISVRPYNVNINGVPAGWTLIRRTNVTGPTPGDGDNAQAIYYKVATATDALATTTGYTWKFNQSEGSVGGILTFYNIETSNPIDQNAGQASGTNLTFTTPSITNTYKNEMVVAFHCFGSSATWTTPAGMTKKIDIASEPVPYIYGESMCVSYAVQAAAGPTGGKTATASNDDEVGVSQIISLIPKTTISYPASPYCSNEGTATVVQTGITGGQYSSSGGLSISATTGAVNLAASSPGIYTVTYKYGVGLAYLTTTTITIYAEATLSGTSTPTCVGSSTGTITASATGGNPPYTYSLNSGAYQASNVFTGLAAGTYTLNVQTSTGCISSTSVTVATNPAVGTPTAITVSAGTEPNCQLTNAITTTTYTTSAANSTGFNWSVSNAAAGTINAATGVMTWANGFSGSVNIQVTANGCNGPSSQVIRAVTVKPTVGTPTAITVSAGTEPACELANGTTTTTYATTATSNTGFNWSLSNDAAGTINAATGVMTWANGFSGSVNIQVTANGCNGPSAEVIRVVTVKLPVGTPAFSSGSSSSRCQAAGAVTYTATATNSTAITYSLDATSTSAGNSINTSTGQVTYVAGWSGTSVITATAAGCSGPTTSTHTVTTTVAPSVSFVYPANPYCSNGTAATVNFSGTSGGAFSSTAGLSIDAVTGTVTISSSTPGTYSVNYSIPASGGCGVYSTSTPLTINRHAIWNGSVSRNWHDPNNWSCGGVPTLTSNALIPSGLTNYPIIYSGLATTHDLAIQSGASIIDSGALTVAGVITNSNKGAINALAGKVEFAANSFQAILSSLFYQNTIKDIVIADAAGLSLTGPLRVTGSVAFGNVNNSVFTTGDSLTLASVATSDAQVKDITNGGINSGNVISGDVIVERYMPAKRAYRFLTAPVNSTGSIKANWMENSINPDRYTRINPYPGYGTNITGAGDVANGFDPTQTHNPSVFTFNNLTQTWFPLPNTSGLMSVGNAYRVIVRGDRSVDMNTNTPPPTPTTLRAKGRIMTGNITLTKPDGGGTPGMTTLSSTPGAYSLIANPYPSAVDWLTATKTDIAGTIYIFDPNVAGSYQRGGYVVYNSVMGTTSDNTSLVDNYLQSGQSFFVQAIGPNPTVTFKETDKAAFHRAVFRSGNTDANVSIQLLLPSQSGSGEAADGSKVYFSDNYDNDIGNEDSYKFTNQDENLAILSRGTALCIEGRKPITGEDSIPLKLWQLSQKSYLLKVNFSYFNYNVEAYLKDKYLSTLTQLNTNGETLVPVNITSDPASIAEDRYKVVFEKIARLPLHLLGIKATEKSNGVEVGWTAESESNMDTYEVERSSDGLTFVSAGSVKAKANPGLSSFYTWFDLVPNNGDNFYRIKSFDLTGTTKYSSVVKVRLEKGASGISIFPNPVRGKSMTLRFTNIEKGKYSIGLFNNLGETIYSASIFHSRGSSNHRLELNKALGPGVYQLRVSNGEQKEIISILVQ
ncbi:MAG: C-terminal target protein [Segetibacter sp.]|nr:C-terminal target protein [Segetibacter sp.]